MVLTAPITLTISHQYCYEIKTISHFQVNIVTKLKQFHILKSIF